MGFSKNIDHEKGFSIFTPKVHFLEYIEGDGKQYIDTGIVPDTETEWELVTSSDVDNLNGLIHIESGYPTHNRFHCGTNKNGYDVNCGCNYVNPIGNNGGSKVKYVLNGLGWGFIDDKKISLNQLSVTTYSIYLFRRNNNLNSSTYIGPAKIYSSKIWQAGKLIQDLRPAIDNKGIYCMYDTITRKYFYNIGTGNFTGSEEESDV